MASRYLQVIAAVSDRRNNAIRNRKVLEEKVIDLKQKKILLVEDEAIIGMATKLTLEKTGYIVIHTTSAEKAVNLVENDSEISLVLMDIDLGSETDGIETSKRILEEREVPIVFVSSHTEPKIVCSTEEITSYGYIVKNSNIVAYDASIKMAYKLFTEKKQREIFARYIQTALENVSEPLFICDTQGDIVFFNKAYLAIQGLKNPDLIQRKFEDYRTQITVFSETGEMQDERNLASTRPLYGNSGENVILYVYHHALKKILVNYYTYAPVYDDRENIIGSYVKIGNKIDKPEARVLKIIEDLFPY